MTSASSLLSGLVTALLTSEPTPHLTRRGTLANWQPLNLSKLRVGGGKALMQPSCPGSRALAVNLRITLSRLACYMRQSSSLPLFLSCKVTASFFSKERDGNATPNACQASESRLTSQLARWGDYMFTYSVQILFCL